MRVQRESRQSGLDIRRLLRGWIRSVYWFEEGERDVWRAGIGHCNRIEFMCVYECIVIVGLLESKEQYIYI